METFLHMETALCLQKIYSIQELGRYLISEYENILLEYKDENKILIQLKDMIGEDFILLLTDNSMFNTKGNTGLTHGGISLEEVVLPFIEVKKNERI